MSQNFDNFPTYDPVIKDKTNYLSDTWASFIATFVQTLQGFLTENGVFLPQLTTAQRDALNNAQNGQLIYNTTTDTVQAFIAGTWTDL